MNDLSTLKLSSGLPLRARDTLARDVPASDRRRWWLIVLAGVAGLAWLSLWLRPLLPVDETRYLTVAWEMWQRRQFLLPSLNGGLYEHKPPVLFWLIHAGWAVGGVNPIWPRLIGPSTTLASLWLLARLGARLWPAQPGVGRQAALLFLGIGFVALFGTALMFDLPLLVCLIAGWIALHRAARHGRWRDWAGFGLTLAAALMTKGPVALVYLLPPLLALRGWAPAGAVPVSSLRIVAALALALALPLAWLLAADRASGGELLHRVLFEQTLGRVQGELGHPRPFHWYLQWLPLLLLPWLAWPPAWRALGRAWRERGDRGLRFVAAAVLPAFLVLCAVGGKQVHYLIPLLALLMLAVARGLAVPARRVERAVGASLGFTALLMAAGFLCLAPRYDLGEAGRYVGAQQRAGRAVAYVGNYQGEFGYFGRLREPVAELRPDQAAHWLRQHPDGLVVVRRKRLQLRGSLPPEYRQVYKTDELLMFRAERLRASGSRFQEPAVASDG